MELARAAETAGAILYDPRRIELPDLRDFAPDALAAAGRVRGTGSGRGQVWFLAPRPATPGTAGWVLRHYRRGGLAARLSQDRYLWCGEAATRGFAELRLLHELCVQGLAVPAPVAARYVREGLTYRADLLTVEIAGARTLAALSTQAGGLDAAQARAVGAAVRRLHGAGVWHADLNAHNVLFDGTGRVWIIDFDRARRRTGDAWRAANLARLRRSLAKVRHAAGAEFDDAAWSALVAGYSAV